MVFNRIILLCTLLISSILSGCASFSQNEVSDVTDMPDMSRYKNKPSAYIDLKFYRGEPQNNNSVEFTQGSELLQPALESMIKESALFSKLTFDEFKKKSMDYTVKVQVYNHGNEAAAGISGFITGFSLGVIPGAATDNYSVSVQLIDRQGRVIKEERSRDSVTTWIGWIFLPAMGNTPEEAVTHTVSNQVKAALKALVQDGKLKYSYNRHLEALYNS